MNITIERKIKRIAIILTGALVAWVWLIATAAASSAPSDVRRIDTENVVKSTDIHEQSPENEHIEKDSHKTEAEDAHGKTESTDSHGKESESHDKKDEALGAGSESSEEHGEEEAHHPAWMIPGWQSIFTLLAVGYFALGVTYLPKIMAKEEH